MIVAALYVHPRGSYVGAPNVEMWDEARDARKYAGPHPVVAHPPCARWCRLAKFVEHQHPNMRVGEDGGCFAAALRAVRRWGGVLEHPAWTLAFRAYGIPDPPKKGWAKTLAGDWITEVYQRNYGHPATKCTWLLYRGATPPPPLDWSAPAPPTRVVSACSKRADGTHWRGKDYRGLTELSKKQASATPLPFRELLLSMARSSASIATERES